VSLSVKDRKGWWKLDSNGYFLDNGRPLLDVIKVQA
jgi:hypothetical protein